MVRECCGGRHKSQETAQPSQPSGPRKYIPSEDIGDYEEYRDKSNRRKSSGPFSGVLFPLDEEGSYGGPPRAPPPPLPGYQKRERKPKVYASYAVSNECSMHADKLEKNESRGKTPPKRRNSQPRRRDSQSRTPSRQLGRSSSFNNPAPVGRSGSFSQPTPSRESDYQPRGQRWEDSLRGRDSQSPLPQRRPSTTLPRMRPRTSVSSSASPTRNRNVSASPDRLRKQSVSPDRGRNLSNDRNGPKTSTDWGYTDFATFRARNSMSGTNGTANFNNNRSMSLASGTAKNSSYMSGSMGSNTSRRTSAPLTDSNTRYSSSSTNSYSAMTSSTSAAGYKSTSSYSASAKTSRSYSSGASEYSSSAKNYTSDYGSDYSRDFSRERTTPLRSTSSRSSSPSKIGLSVLKTPTIPEWDQMGVLGLTSKMFSKSSSIKEASDSHALRRESVTSKMM